ASAGEAKGRCNTNDGKQWADFSVTYTTSGSYDSLTNWWWTINGTKRDKNNVAAQVKQALPGTNPIVAAFESGDNVENGQGHRSIGGTLVPRVSDYYGAFQFVFDLEGDDPTCKGKTETW